MFLTNCIAQSFVNDTGYVRIMQLPPDSNRVNALFEKGLHASISNIELAGFLGKRAYEEAKKLNFSNGLTKSCDLISIYYKQKGDFNKAYLWLKKSILPREKLKDNFGLAITHFQMANLFRDMGNTKMALEFAKKSLGYSKKLGQSRFIALSNGCIAAVFYEMKELDSALVHYQISYELHLKNKDSSAITMPLTNMGVIYNDLKNYKKAIEFSKSALEFSKNQHNLFYTLSCYYNLAQAYLESNDLKNAGEMLSKCLELSTSYAETQQKMKIYKLHSRYLSKTGDFRSAYEFDQKYQLIKDSIDKAEIKKNLNDLETKYQTEKKEKENELLKQKRKIDQLSIADGQRKSFILIIILVASILVLVITALFLYNRNKTAKILATQNEQINKQNTTLKTLNKQLIESEEELQTANQAKEQLISIISHDISSPLQALSNYQKSAFVQKDPDWAAYFTNTVKETYKINALVSSLLEFSFTNQKGFKAVLQDVYLAHTAKEVTDLLKNLAEEKKINLSVQIDESIVVKTDSNLLKMILRNLISNSIKYSHVNTSVKIQWDSINRICYVKDQGNGLPAEVFTTYTSPLSQTERFANAKTSGTGFGIQIIKTAIHHLNSKLLIESDVNGTSVGFTLPL